MFYKNCPECGGLLEDKLIKQENTKRLICKECRFIFYINPIPAVAVILFNKNKEILLVKRKYEPQSGDWSLPAGFLEYNETAEQNAIREAKEETNLNIRINRLFDVYSGFDDPRKHVLLVVYYGEIIGGELKPGDDAAEAIFFALDNLPTNVAFTTHRDILDRLISETKSLPA